MDVIVVNMLNELAIPIFVAMIGFIGKKFVSFINKKSDEIEANVSNERAKTYLNLATNTVTEVVESLNQTTVAAIKKASADGKLTEEEALAIKDEAIQKTLKLLTDEAKEAICTVFGDLEEYLDILVESAVSKSKKK